MAKYTEGEHFPVQYVNFWNMQKEPDYGGINLLDLEECPDAEANAKLYAASPELLKMLIEAKRYVEYCCSDLNTANEILPKIEATIKRATE